MRLASKRILFTTKSRKNLVANQAKSRPAWSIVIMITRYELNSELQGTKIIGYIQVTSVPFTTCITLKYAASGSQILKPCKRVYD